MKALEGFGVSKVIVSDNPNFKAGDFISGFTGWEEYSIISITKAQQLRKIEHDHHIPLSFHLGLLGNFFDPFLQTNVSIFCFIGV